MNFELRFTKNLITDFNKLSNKTQTQLKKKLILLKQNPFQQKALEGFKGKIFRVRFKDNNIEKRLIYKVANKKIILIGIIDRKHNYKELKQILSNYYLEDELNEL